MTDDFDFSADMVVLGGVPCVFTDALARGDTRAAMHESGEAFFFVGVKDAPNRVTARQNHLGGGFALWYGGDRIGGDLTHSMAEVRMNIINSFLEWWEKRQ